MAGDIRRAVIRRIAANERCSFAVAAHIYACKPIKIKMRLCEQERAREASSSVGSRRDLATPTPPTGAQK